ncbi:mandelate racemase/muconate lactonizing enzyme family protein (plasmid) [Embleya sp. NBC_00888]|uniref:mandelate racemase/muconate lactonizing enzyme family protein n=1 Tax=Embleya sp. NBC_00888 TaxID=2975960 RepID=UPI002F919F2F|nr:mandelate racemase/muconate lactonizing enzyme family protein [Embleya sp. NBC_00888]
MRIRRITVHEVIVRAHHGAIETPGLDKPLHKLPHLGSSAWSIQFDEVPKAVLELECDDGTIGLGEFYRGHDWPTVEAIATELLGRDLRRLNRQALPFAKLREYDGFEVAIWDAYARAHQLRVVDLLGGPVRSRVPVGAWSGQRTPDEIGDVARWYHALGYTCLKLKCDLDDDVVAWCTTIADAAPGMQVVLDPNERFEQLHHARRIADRLADIGNVLCLEDPLPHWMRHEYAALRTASRVPVVRHIALPYPILGNRIEDIVTAVQNHEVDAFNINAGLADFQRMDHVAAIAGLPTFHGSEIDLGILEAAYLHSCAAAASCTWPSDIFGRNIRSHDLLAEPLELQPPYALLPDGIGLGVDLDHDAVAEHRTTRKEYLA